MTNKLRPYLQAVAFATLFCPLALEPVQAYSTTPPVNRTGAPGHNDCSNCHRSLGTGNVSLTFSGDTEYTPGQMYTLLVTIDDPGQKRFGFSMAARGGENDTNDVGTWSAGSAETQVHGTNNSLVSHKNVPFPTGPNTFTVNWTAPSTGVGDVTFYIAAVAANGNGSNGSGDNTYLSSLTITEPAPPSEPPTLSDLVFLGNGSAQLTLTGIPGRTYTVEHSENLEAWQLLEMTTLAASTAPP